MPSSPTAASSDMDGNDVFVLGSEDGLGRLDGYRQALPGIARRRWPEGRLSRPGPRLPTAKAFVLPQRRPGAAPAG
jgi:hypothetical protein